MARLSDLELDPKGAEEGVWRTYRLGTRFKVARSGGPRWRAAVREAIAEREALKGGEALTEEDRVLALKEATAKAVLTDWSGFFEEDGKTPDPYTWEKGLAAFTNPRLFHLYEFVVEASWDLDTFADADAGKSLAGSTGSSDGVVSSQP